MSPLELHFLVFYIVRSSFFLSEIFLQYLYRFYYNWEEKHFGMRKHFLKKSCRERFFNWVVFCCFWISLFIKGMFKVTLKLKHLKCFLCLPELNWISFCSSGCGLSLLLFGIVTIKCIIINILHFVNDDLFYNYKNVIGYLFDIIFSKQSVFTEADVEGYQYFFRRAF